MPSVASQPPVHAPRPNHQASRVHSDANKGASTPFADLLDSSAPESEPAPRQTRSERPDRSEQPKPADDRAGATPSDANANQDSPSGQTKSANDGAEANPFDGDKKEASEGVTSTDTAAKHDTAAGADVTAALDAIFVAPDAPAVPQAVAAVVQPLVLTAAPADAAPETDALLQAAGQGPKPSTAPKADQTQSQGKGDKTADTQAQGSAPAGTQNAVPQTDAVKDGLARGNGDKASGELNRAAAEALTKLQADAPAQQDGDAAAAGKASADAIQNLGVAAPANTVSQTTPATNAANAVANAPAQAAAVPLAGLAVEIATQSHAGKNHFDIRLDPPELGRINVHLNVDRDGNISTHVIADRSDTLDLLKRDASTLERALQQAGLKTSDNALEFSLRQQAFTHDDTVAQAGASLIVPDDDPAPLEALRQGYGRLLGLGGGLDIRV